MVQPPGVEYHSYYALRTGHRSEESLSLIGCEGNGLAILPILLYPPSNPDGERTRWNQGGQVLKDALLGIIENEVVAVNALPTLVPEGMVCTSIVSCFF